LFYACLFKKTNFKFSPIFGRDRFASETVIQKRRPIYPLRETLHICIEGRRNFPFTSSLSWTSTVAGCVYVWSHLVCLCMSCGSGICTWASQSVCLCVCLWHVCHVSEYVQSQSCYIRRQLDHPSFREKAVKFSGSFNFRYILYWFICAAFLSTLIDAVVFLIHFSHFNVFPCISKHFRRDRFHYFMLYCCDR